MMTPTTSRPTQKPSKSIPLVLHRILVLALLTYGLPSLVHGDSNPTFVTNETLGTLRNNWQGWVGMQVTVGNQPLMITSLGRMAVSGNTSSHQVKIVDAASGVDVPGASVTVPAGGTPGQFNYAALATPVTLSANTVYYVASHEINGGDQWYDDDTTLTPTSVAMINHEEASGETGGWFLHNGLANHSYVPVDFKYAISVPTGSPAKGFEDSSDCTSSLGWACDPDSYGHALQVNFYDGPKGTGQLIGPATANQPGNAGVTAACGGTGNHNFIWPMPAAYHDNQTHTIYAYAVDIDASNHPTGQEILIPSSPSPLTTPICYPPGGGNGGGPAPTGPALGNTLVNFNGSGNQVIRFDVDGNAIDAHDGDIRYFNGKYYLYGTSYNCGFQYTMGDGPFCGFKSYSSTDFVHWKDEGFLFNAQTSQWQDRCDSFGCFRPHVLFNAQTNQYVLWFNQPNDDTNTDAPSAYFVLVSNTPTGPFVESPAPTLAHYRGGPLWGTNGDHNLFLDDDGAAYIVYDAIGPTTFNIEKLDSSFTKSVQLTAQVPFHGEAPALFKRQGIYYLLESGYCGYCGGVALQYQSATSLAGPWSSAMPLSPDSCGGQETNVLELGTNTIFMSDLWYQGPQFSEAGFYRYWRNEGRANYYWGPLTFNSDGTLQSITRSASTTNPFPGTLSSQNVASGLDQSSGVDGFTQTCDIAGNIQRLQTFKPGSSGLLTLLSVTTFQSGGGYKYTWNIQEGQPGYDPFQQNSLIPYNQLVPDADLTIDLVDVNASGNPGNVLGFYTVPRLTKTNQPAGGIGFSPRKVSVQPNIFVQAGHEYGIRLHAAITTEGCYGVTYNDSGIYSNGRELKSTDGGATFTVEAGRALKFETTLTAGVAPVPVVTGGSAQGTVGQAFSYQIQATNSPMGYTAQNLPSGLSLNAVTGLISGTPTSPTSSAVNITLNASNAGGPSAPATLTLTIYAADANAAFMTAAPLGTLRNNWPGWAGMQITVGAQALTVTSLGRIIAAGNTSTHQVKIVNASDGSDVPGGSVTISPGGTSGQFSYAPLTGPLTLSANTIYFIVSHETNGGDFWYDDDAPLTPASVATIDHSEAAADGGIWFLHSTANHGYVPVNFKYSLGSGSTGDGGSGDGLVPSGPALGNTLVNFNGSGNPVIRFDVNGNAVDAHDGEIRYFNGKYFLYGTSYNCGYSVQHMEYPWCGFKTYSSMDLAHWKDEGYLFNPQGSNWQALCAGIGCYRPHILYNPGTANYVMWFDGGPPNPASSYYVLTSNSPTGPFSLVLPQPTLARAPMLGDENIFEDDDGSAYIVYTASYFDGSPETFKIAIEKLNPSFTDSTKEIAHLSLAGDPHPWHESPAMFKRNGLYYIVYGPNCGYCSHTPTEYQTAPTPMGPWTYRGILNDTSCNGQPTHVVTSKGSGAALFMSDLWSQDRTHIDDKGNAYIDWNQGRANYFWGTLSFNGDGSLQPFSCVAAAANPFPGSPGSQDPIPDLDQSSGIDGFSGFCDIAGGTQRLQTFKPGFSGTLTSLSFTAFQNSEVYGPNVDSYPYDYVAIDVPVNADLILDLVTVGTNGQPMGSPLGTYTFPRTAVGNSARKITITPNLAVQADKEYGLRLRSAATQGCYGFAYNDSNPYPRGRELYSGNGGVTWTVEVNRALKFETTLTASAGSAPIGFHDSSDCTSSLGWTCDSDDFSQPLTVDFYDGPKGSGQKIGSALANQPGNAGVTTQCGGIGNHNFVWPTPAGYADNQSHSIYVYAENIGPAGSDVLIPNSPRAITGCQAPIDATPPQISFATLQDFMFVSGNASIAATASDNVGVTKVEFYADGALQSTLNTAPYTFSWNTISTSNGHHTLLVKAYDAANNNTTASVTAIVNNLPFSSASSPAVWYHLDESAGTLMDASGNGYNATSYNGATYGIAGKLNSALHFDGVEAYADSDVAPRFSTALTAMGWIKADDVTTLQGVFGQGRDFYGSGWQFFLINGVLKFTVNTDNLNNENEMVAATPYTDTAGWHHIAATYDGATARLYVDGQLKNSATGGGPIVYLNGEKLTLGRLAFGDFYKYKGALDEVELFGAALTQNQIQAQMNATGGLDVTPPSAPTNVQASPVSASQIDLSWSASQDNPGGSGLAGYKLDVALDSGFFTILPAYNNKDLGNALSVHVTGLSAQANYFMQVRAYDHAGNPSANSQTAQAMTTSVQAPRLISVTMAPAGAPHTYTLVVSADNNGNPGPLTYQWTAPAGVTLTNATAATATAAVTAAGVYPISVLVSNPQGASVPGSVTIQENQTLTRVAVTPQAINVPASGPQSFMASAYDQFNFLMSPQPAFAWVVTNGSVVPNTVSSANAVFTASSSPGAYSVSAGVGSVSDTAGGQVTALPSVADPVITPNGGTFVSQVPITITDATSSASIHYTIDGGNPTASSALYTGPFNLTQTTVVKAVAFAAGMNDSNVITSNGFTVTMPSPVPNLTVSVVSLAFSAIAGGSNPSAQSVTLSNTGTAASNWSANSDVAWLTVAPFSGSVAPGINPGPVLPVNVTVGVLTPNTYTGRLTFRDQSGNSQVVTVTFTITPGPIPISVAITPTTVSLAPGEKQPFTANVTGTADQAVTWTLSSSLSGAAAGTIDSSGQYAAPTALASAATVTVHAVSHADSTKSAEAVVSLTPPVTVTLPQIDLSSLPKLMKVDGTITIMYPYAVRNFNWTFTTGASFFDSSFFRSASVGTAVASFSTTSPSAGLGAYHLAPGNYGITVQAVNGSQVSPPATASITLAETGLSNARAYPNPWRADKESQEKIVFDQMNGNSTIKIYTVSGRWIKTLTTSVGAVAWDLRTDGGDKAASGIYVYLITDDQGNKTRGKLVIAR
jgi:beta-xylosidase